MSADDIYSMIVETKNVHEISADRNLCIGPPKAKHMSGGACVAHILQCLEVDVGRPIIAANAQFLKAPSLGQTARIGVQVLHEGRSISQVRATMKVDDSEAVTVTAALGARPDIGSHRWTAAPVVSPPLECQRIPFVREDPGDLHTNLDMRMAADERDSLVGRFVSWIKAPNCDLVPASFLALVADYLPEAINLNIGRRAGATSLDNTIRIIAREHTDWLLCETNLDGIENGLFHGRMSIFSQDGVLMAHASQSGVVHLLPSR